ncbi:hypothetical protein DFH07DRAFT_769508 [Mycena maculata]|uniref:Uncharacterized protein n=1 Tax=Mycena maculata TaxID=230809 RepID=A0AAD7JNW4_9AGAR|nr:hypothetical protein DFH07DRAFT_769508 [Mycena maculata]
MSDEVRCRPWILRAFSAGYRSARVGSGDLLHAVGNQMVSVEIGAEIFAGKPGADSFECIAAGECLIPVSMTECATHAPSEWPAYHTGLEQPTNSRLGVAHGSISMISSHRCEGRVFSELERNSNILLVAMAHGGVSSRIVQFRKNRKDEVNNFGYWMGTVHFIQQREDRSNGEGQGISRCLLQLARGYTPPSRPRAPPDVELGLGRMAACGSRESKGSAFISVQLANRLQGWA